MASNTSDFKPFNGQANVQPASGSVPYQLGHVTLLQFNLHFRFEAKRVIIRQGHKAENFYFILSGTGKDKHKHIARISTNLMIE